MRSGVHVSVFVGFNGNAHHPHQLGCIEAAAYTFMQTIVKMQLAVLYIRAEMEVVDVGFGCAPFAQFEVVGRYHSGCFFAV